MNHSNEYQQDIEIPYTKDGHRLYLEAQCNFEYDDFNRPMAEVKHMTISDVDGNIIKHVTRNVREDMEREILQELFNFLENESA